MVIGVCPARVGLGISMASVSQTHLPRHYTGGQRVLQKHDNMEAAVIQNQTKLSRMKTNYLKMNWLIPMLGIAVVAGTYLTATTYLDVERKVEAEQAFVVTVDQVYQAQQIGSALKAIKEGEVKGAAERLDLLLCNRILRLDSELAASDARTKALIGMAFQKIAAARPKTESEPTAGGAQQIGDARTAAEKILTVNVASARGTQSK